MEQYEREKLPAITKAGAVCALCGGSLEDERKHLSALRPNGKAPANGATVEERGRKGGGASAGEDDSEVLRSDYHRECWKKAAKGDYLSFWLARRPEPPKKEKLTRQERNAILLGLFHVLMRGSDPVDNPARFVLAHLLMRYRALVLLPPRLDAQGRKWIVFETPQTEEKSEILDIRLSDEQAAETLRKINEYLYGAPPDETAASSGDSPPATTRGAS